jgi:hypothetical protein
LCFPVPVWPALTELPAVTELLALPELLTGPELTVAVRVVPELLAVPVLEGALEPQPALITLIRATIVRTASGRSVLLMVAPPVVELG